MRKAIYSILICGICLIGFSGASYAGTQTRFSIPDLTTYTIEPGESKGKTMRVYDDKENDEMKVKCKVGFSILGVGFNRIAKRIDTLIFRNNETTPTGYDDAVAAKEAGGATWRNLLTAAATAETNWGEE